LITVRWEAGVEGSFEYNCLNTTSLWSNPEVVIIEFCSEIKFCTAEVRSMSFAKPMSTLNARVVKLREKLSEASRTNRMSKSLAERLAEVADEKFKGLNVIRSGALQLICRDGGGGSQRTARYPC
jgi:hypothetical protein